MPEKNNSTICSALGLNSGSGKCENSTCIDADKIYDSSRDKDCIEDLKVFVNEQGQEIIDHATNIRAKSIEILWAHITANSIAFNRGYYQVNIRYYFKICFEACVPVGNLHEFCGLAVFDKQSVLFGSEGNVSIFTLESGAGSFCADPSEIKGDFKTNNPKVVLEVATPIVLGVKLVDKNFKFGCCFCVPEQIPQCLCGCCFPTNICDNCGCKSLFVSIGLFSLTRLERPVSILIESADYCIPERDGTGNNGVGGISDTDPCTLFKSMNFPTCDFFPPNSKKI